MTEPVFTTIFKSPITWEVRLLQQKLKSEGIEAFVDGENITIMQPHLTGVNGGSGLRVYSEDATRAAAILRTLQQKNAKQPICIGNCPKCKSKNIMRTKWPTCIAILSMFFLGIPHLFCSRRCCRDCGEIWWE